MRYFVTAIGTDSGKTLFSAILAQALEASYWKPIQAGFPTDKDTVADLTTGVKILPERYVLKKPASPHDAAEEEGIRLEVKDFQLPEVKGNVVVEGAGGILVPINETENVIDIAKHLDLEVILVANLYLGSINHTLLSIDYLKRNHFQVKGIVFNGKSNPASEKIILDRSGLKKILHIEQEPVVNKEVVAKYASKLNWNGSDFS